MWVDDETGETFDTCPNCLQMEADLRKYRTKLTRAERAAEQAKVAKRDGAAWKETRDHWLATFPNLNPRALGIKSERATAFFQRLDSGASVQDCKDAITGARLYPYLLYGRRVAKAGGQAALAVDFTEIMALKRDREFDHLVEVGRSVRE